MLFYENIPVANENIHLILVINFAYFHSIVLEGATFWADRTTREACSFGLDDRG
jgi:hypothetical protein